MAYVGDEISEAGGEWLTTMPLAFLSWEFYDLAVLKMPDGFYISTDSGCSCPSPFESHTLADFTGPLTAEQVIEEYTSLVVVDGGDGDLSRDDLELGIISLRELLV